MTVALETELTPALLAEGHAREIVHHIQNLRKDAGFEITDRIQVAAETASAELMAALEIHHDYICRETLATRLEFKPVTDGVELESNGLPIIMAVHRLKAAQPVG
jgi:isoleucyl-tRNA synthetase